MSGRSEGSGSGIWGRRLGRVALVLAGIALLAWGGVLGWFLHEWRGQEDVEVTVDRPVEVYAPEVVREGTVPNVIGLTEDEALTVLSDAGVALGSVATHVVANVGPSGLVIRQSPRSGAEIGKRSVSLELSGPAVMPELEGEGEAEAKDRLADLGARISVVTEYQRGAAEGTVLATDPAAGEAIVDKATVRVAEPLSSVFLTEIPAVAASCRTAEEAVLGGEAQSEAVICLPQAGANPRSVTYELGGDIESLTANLGLADDGNAEAPAEFRVYVDGDLELTRRLTFGESEAIKVPLYGHFQLRLEAAAAGVTAPGSPDLRAVFGEPRLVGSRSAVDGIAEGLGS